VLVGSVDSTPTCGGDVDRSAWRAAYSLTEAGIQVRCSCGATSCSAIAVTTAI
jgi:hypothetical protein